MSISCPNQRPILRARDESISYLINFLQSGQIIIHNSRKILHHKDHEILVSLDFAQVL